MNMDVIDWGILAGLTGALLDRLTHRVHILEANGESSQLAGITPETQEPQEARLTDRQAAGMKRLTPHAGRGRYRLGAAILLRHSSHFYSAVYSGLK